MKSSPRQLFGMILISLSPIVASCTPEHDPEWNLCRNLVACLLVDRAQHGCEPDLPANRIAKLETSRMESFLAVGASNARVLVIDGQPSINCAPFGGALKLVPGWHDVRAGYNDAMLGSEKRWKANLRFNAQPGHSYQIRGSRNENFVRIWIEDEETKKSVGMATIIIEPENER